MTRGGARPGAGRPVGSVNRRTAEVIAEAMAAGKTPLEFLLETMRNEDLDHKDRAWAAEKAAPFMHPRPAPMERTVSLDLPDTSTVEGIDKALDAIIAAMGRGDISPQEGQGFISAVETRRKAIETGDMLARIEALEATKR
jgi:hypothetical protein